MNYKFTVIILLATYMATMIGFVTPHQQAWYLSYMPYFLGFNLVVLLAYAEKKTSQLFLYTGGMIIFSFLVEYIALLVEGNFYGNSFGTQLGGVPPLIGLLWFVMVYSASYLGNKIPSTTIVKIGVSTVLSMGLFSLVNQVAPKLDFWHSPSSAIIFPWVAPLIISLLGAWIFVQYKITLVNKIALYIYGGLVVFFVGMLLFLK